MCHLLFLGHFLEKEAHSPMENLNPKSSKVVEPIADSKSDGQIIIDP
ncbi:MAG: hypothetical protein IPQ04_15440 [Saprospiraceae bacterium]|nr:hypothetical protein [Saprospiraceae bacterium]